MVNTRKPRHTHTTPCHNNYHRPALATNIPPFSSKMLTTEEHHLLQIKIASSSDLAMLKRLNALIFPLQYHDKFYKDLAQSNGGIACRACLILFNGEIIGTFSCRLETVSLSIGTGISCYVMTFGLLPKYRMRGMGAWMWNKLVEMYGLLCEWFVLHVQFGNSMALKFYLNRGFTEYEVIQGYYKKLCPSNAILLAKRNE